MRISEHDTLDGLVADLSSIPTRFVRGTSRAVKKNVDQGNRLAKANAKRTAGSHGKLYPRAFSAEMTGLLSGEYGPDASMPQGDMSFEYGSRNQAPHLDLNRSADIIGPKFANDIGDVLDGLFW